MTPHERQRRQMAIVSRMLDGTATTDERVEYQHLQDEHRRELLADIPQAAARSRRAARKAGAAE